MASLRILIAEDDKLSATLLKAMLEAEGHSVCAVSGSGGDAVEAARRLAPDAVLMDIFLRDEMSGVEAARTIVRDLAIPTLFVTGASDRALLEQVVESGALGLMKKPVSADELRVNLRILLHHQNLSHRLRVQAAEFKRLFMHAPVGMFVRDTVGRLLDCNEALARLMGYDAAASLLAAIPVAQGLYHPDGGELCCAEAHDTACEGLPGVPVRLRHREGRAVAATEYRPVLSGVPADAQAYLAVIIPR
ncbi:response regulator [Desulfovibrio psychrotolerans]|uniref:Response regulator n=1 Tax=Desulfovibrio psychrotolerans TaxID=415242 RepID=A0A7J0BTT0_9BACT|nr:response regulator [Desulfovibrio psychrotolerans]GFM37120.1 hypothetical protein DSM19430T_18040 [Desulfovibrio psychrotolerans]